MAAMKKEIPFLFVFYLISSCIYIQNQKLKKIEYPETPYFLGFVPGQVEVNPSYSKDWCNWEPSLFRGKGMERRKWKCL